MQSVGIHLSLITFECFGLVLLLKDWWVGVAVMGICRRQRKIFLSWYMVGVWKLMKEHKFIRNLVLWVLLLMELFCLASTCPNLFNPPHPKSTLSRIKFERVCILCTLCYSFRGMFECGHREQKQNHAWLK